MAFNFPFTMSDVAITLFVDGSPRQFPSDHPSFNALRDAINAGDEAVVRSLADVRRTVANQTLGRVQILDNTILVAGKEVSGRLVERILEMVALGSEAVSGYIKFLDNLYDNPSKTAIDELYLWIEACDCPITPDGHLLAYRYVNHDYFDGHSRTVFNKPASLMTDAELKTYAEPVIGGVDNEVTTQVIDGVTNIWCPRNAVDDKRDNHCSNGLHFCSYSYLPSYAGHGPVLVVKINPADVVSIPSDYNNAKGRTSKYQVLSQIEQGIELTPYYSKEYEDYEDYEDDYDEYEDDFNDEVEVTPTPTRGGAKLTPDQVREIKHKYHPMYISGDITLTAIGEKFGVHREQIARIFRGDTWSHVS